MQRNHLTSRARPKSVVKNPQAVATPLSASARLLRWLLVMFPNQYIYSYVFAQPGTVGRFEAVEGAPYPQKAWNLEIESRSNPQKQKGWHCAHCSHKLLYLKRKGNSKSACWIFEYIFRVEAWTCYFREGVEPPFRVVSKYGYCWNGIFESPE